MLLKKEMKLAGERGLTLELTDAAKTRLLAQNDHPEWGARPLRRIIWKFVREPLALSVGFSRFHAAGRRTVFNAASASSRCSVRW